MMFTLLAGLAWVTAIVFRMLGWACVAARSTGQRTLGAPRVEWPSVTVLVPVHGVADGVEVLTRNVQSALCMEYPDWEIIFCVADASDPAIPHLKRLLRSATHARVMTGQGRGELNPKLSNLRKGYEVAEGQLVLFSDVNNLVERDHLKTLVSELGEGIGIVSTAVHGIEPASLGGRVECAFLNGYATPGLLASELLGQSMAMGITMLVNKAMLDGAGGIAAMDQFVIDDIAATKIVRRLGLRVHLSSRTAVQIIGDRTLGDVTARHARWAFFRKVEFPLFSALEPLTHSLVMVVPLLLLARWFELSWVAALLGHYALWLVPEWIVCSRCGLPVSVSASLLREALLPLTWIKARLSRHVMWHGRAIAETCEPKA